MAEFNALRTVTASGASQTLTAAGAVDPVYDITLTASCTLTLAAQQTTPARMQTITAWLRQDSTGGRAVTLPAGIAWPGAAVPSLNTAAGRYDVFQFTTLDGGTSWLGSIVASAALAANISVTPITGTVYAGQTVTVTGAYYGTRPTNLDVSINSGAFTTLPAGTATITNGTISFPLTAPAAGPATIAIRGTNTGITSAAASFTVAAASAPDTVSVTGEPASGQAALTMRGTAKGAAITSFTVQRSTSSTGTFTTVITVDTSSPPTSGVTTASYTDTGLTNDTAYYYKVIANTAAGNTTSAASAAVTPSGSLAVPAHYLAATSARRGRVAAPASANNTLGYVDVIAWIKPDSYAVDSTFFARWGQQNASSAAYLMQLKADGTLFIAWVTGSGTFRAQASTAALSAKPATTPSNSLGIMVRIQANMSNQAITAPAGSAVATIPAGGSIVFSAAVPSANDLDANVWTQVGTTITGLGATGFGPEAIPATVGGFDTDNTLVGRVYKALVRNIDGAVTFNPDFTAQATGTTSFVDTAAAPNTWAVPTGGIV